MSNDGGAAVDAGVGANEFKELSEDTIFVCFTATSRHPNLEWFS